MSSDPLRTYEYELIEQMEAVLDAYHFYLLEKGVSARQAEQKLANAEMFLIQYHAYHYLDDLTCLIPERISDFLNSWYFERVDCRSETDWIETSETIKEFLQYLFDIGTLDFPNPQIYLQAATPIKSFHLLEKDYLQKPMITSTQEDVSLEELLNDDLNFDDESFSNQSIRMIASCSSIGEVLEQLNHNLPHVDQRKNVISLVPSTVCDEQEKCQFEMETISDNIFALLRGNRVFQRWLERNRRHLNDVRSTLRDSFQFYDSLLLNMNQMISRRPTSSFFSASEREILERFDKQLWSLRNRISAELRLDLRSLCL